MAWAKWLLPVPWTDEQRIFAPLDEACRGQVEDETAIHLWVKGEIEVVDRPLRIAERGFLPASDQQTITTAREFVMDQCRQQIDRRHRLGLCLAQSCFQYGGHAAQS